MAHYHIRLRDAGGGSWAATQLPSVKAPTAKPPKAANVKPPTPPKVPSPGPKPGGPKPKPGGAPKAGISPVAALSRGIGAGTRLARAGERTVNRVSEFGEEFNRDGGAAMGHYHFNIPSRGSRMRDVSTMGGMSSTAGGMSSTAGGQSSTMGGMSSTSGVIDAGTSAGAKKAAQTRSHGGGTSKPTYVASQKSKSRWIVSHSGSGEQKSIHGSRKDAERSANKYNTPGYRFPGASHDTGTSEGAKKAAQTRSGGFQPRVAGGFGGAAAAKSHPEGFVQGVGPAQSKPRPAPEPFRGYDSRRRK